MGNLVSWPNPAARWLAVLVPDLGESPAVYSEVADTLVAAGAEVAGYDADDDPITDFEPVVDDLAVAVGAPELPMVLIGQAVGGMIAVRYAQRYPEPVAALVLSAPVLGPWQDLDLLSEPEIPAGRPRRETLAAIEECLTTIDFDHPLGDSLPGLWLHSADDADVPLADTRAGMDRIRGLRFEERIYPGAQHDLLRDKTSGALADVVEFVPRVVQTWVPDEPTWAARDPVSRRRPR
jgi:alpha-beta hydrolase superfamily lysophospholipase